MLVHSPGSELDLVSPSTYSRFLFEDAIDSERFREQHYKFANVLRAEGVKVIALTEVLREDTHMLKAINRRPNTVYTRDSVTITPHGYIKMRMKGPARRGEPQIVETAMLRMTLPQIVPLNSHATMEGGDLIFQDKDTLLVGVGNRTNLLGVRQLHDKARKLGLKCLVAVHLPSSVIHLDGIIMIIDRNFALVHSRSMRSPVTIYDLDRHPKKSILRDYLKKSGLGLIEVTDYERRKRATNVVTLRARKVIGYAGNGRVERELERQGVDFIAIEGSELVRGGGGPRCMTAPILRD